MTFEKKTNQLSNFPEYGLENPEIFIKRAGEYPCFSVDDVYNELFSGEKADIKDGSALIYFPESTHKIKEFKDRLEFLLPQHMFKTINNFGKKEGDNIKVHHYKEFFMLSSNDNMITRILLSLFSTPERNSEKIFIESFQNHYIQILKLAKFKQPKLNESLCSLVDKYIAPEAVSLTANKAFHSLVESDDHTEISKAIANIFISAMLGLYSMKYSETSDTSPGYPRKRNYVYRKTYLLNELGMEFIWTPENISNSYIKIQDVLYLYECGLYKEAYSKALLWLNKCNCRAGKRELALAYYVLGACLFFCPEQCDHNSLPEDTIKNLESCLPRALLNKEDVKEKSKDCLDICVSLDENIPEAFYLLYEYYKSKKDMITSAFDNIKTAFEKNYVKAIIEMATLFVKGQELSVSITGNIVDVINTKLSVIISNEKEYSEKEVRDCLYLRGCIILKYYENESEAQADFEKAARKGHEKAKLEISRKERMEYQRFPSFSTDRKAPCCFVNSVSGNNLIFVSTLPNEEWSLYTTDKQVLSEHNVNYVKDIDEFITQRHLSDFDFPLPKIVFMFTSIDEDRNLNECLILLDKLFNIALRSADNQKDALIDCIDIYIGAKYEMASMLIDANVNDMGKDIYFKVHVVDETRDSVHQLLCDAPLFIPLLTIPKRDDSVNVVLFGCSETNYKFIKESIGCAYLGNEYPVNITMLGTGADRMERRLRQECPGLFHDPYIKCIRPRFISCCIEEENFPSLIYGSEYDNHPDSILVKTLSMGNYFVVDLSNDHDSIRFAMELRTWLLRSRGTFDRTPFIGVKCTDSQNSYLAAHLTLSGQSAGDTYYSRYDLFPFGISREMYSYQRLIMNPRLAEIALKIHKSYYGEKDREAENDYYSFSYNADSSLLTAIGLSYRLFAVGLYFSQKAQYHYCGIFNTLNLFDNYDEVIKSKGELAAALEQSRWNGFMLSRGWESADVNQVRAYKEQSTGSSHKHMLAKLHPFIREWEDLASDELLQILRMLKSKFNYEKLPQTVTRKGIKDTSKFLKGFAMDDENVH